MALAGSVSQKALTYRVENIPFGTSEEDLKSHFHSDDRNHIKVKSLVPAVDTAEFETQSDYTATIFFRPPVPTQSTPRLIDDSLSVDKDFLGFTPLYAPQRGKGSVAVDIIAVTGLAGHAYGSWAHSSERMWLRDYLPKDVPNARILTYGYPSKLQGNASMSILSDHTNTFVHRLNDMRASAQCEDRPVIFIGHSLGCLLIKKALTDVGLMGLNSSRIPVRSIIFLAAPHRGLNIKALQTLVKGAATEQLILELRAESPTLTDINQRFAYTARNIDILTCYETQPTKTAILVDGLWKREGAPVMMVSPDSASQYFSREKRIPVDANHSQIAKIMKGEGGIYPNIKSAIRQSLISTPTALAGMEASPVPITQANEAPTMEFLKVANLDNGPLRQSLKYQYGTGSEADSGTQGVREELKSSSPNSIEQRDSKSLPINLKEDIRSQDPESNQDASLSRFLGSTAPNAFVPTIRDSSRSITLDTVDSAFSGNEARFCWPCDHCKVDNAVAGYHFRCVNSDYCCLVTCRKCYDKGLRCAEDETHEVAKCIVKPSGLVYRCVPYVETSVLDEDIPLVKAIKLWKKKDVYRLAKDRNALRAQFENGYTSLHLAVQIGFLEGVKVLLENGATRDARDFCKHTPLMVAVQYDFPDIIQLLLEQGADVGTVGSYNGSSTALHIAAFGCQTDLVELLLRNDAKIDSMSSRGTPLCLAAERGHVPTLQYLIDAGANVSLAGPAYKRSPLFNAVYYGYPGAVQFLLRSPDAVRKNIDEVDIIGRTPLFTAVCGGYSEIARLLLDAGADTHKRCGETELTSLECAVAKRDSEFVKLLLQYPVAINEMNKRGYFALMLAILYDDKDTCQLLLEHNADPNLYDGSGNLPLAKACFAGMLEIVKLLLKHGAQVNQPTKNGNSALSLSTIRGKTEIVKCLLKYGANSCVPQEYRDWNHLKYNDSVSRGSRLEIEDMIFRAHRGIRRRDCLCRVYVSYPLRKSGPE